MRYITNVQKGCGGNHGHKFRNYLSVYFISKLFNMKYLHTPCSVTDAFGVGHGEELCDFKYIRHSEPFLLGNWSVTNTPANWVGEVRDADIKNFNKEELHDMFFAARNYVFFPHTVQELINNNILPHVDIYNFFEGVTYELFNKYSIVNKDRPYPFLRETDINIAVHINRGVDACLPTNPRAKDSTLERFQFSLDYFDNIINQITVFLKSINKKHTFYIYTEALNSESIVDFFSKKENVQLRIGCNRGTRTEADLNVIENIYHAFIQSDILVTCNSSFSMTSTFLRYKKPFIFKQHIPFKFMPYDWSFTTDEDGNFNTDKLSTYFYE